MPGGMKSTEKSETSSGQPNLGRSQTERRKQSNSRDDPAAQLFDDNISDKKKVWMHSCPYVFVIIFWYMTRSCIVYVVSFFDCFIVSTF